MWPINFGEAKTNSIEEFTENIRLCFSDFNIENGYVNVDKSLYRVHIIYLSLYKTVIYFQKLNELNNLIIFRILFS